VRYYLGVDWADQTHAVWVVDESGTKIAARAVSHTAEGLGEWGRELDEWRAQGIDLWAAIERPDGRVVDFLLDHGVVVYPVNPKALDQARDRFRQSGAAPTDVAPPSGRGRGAAHLPYEVGLVEAAPLLNELAVDDTDDGDEGDSDLPAGGGNAEKLVGMRAADRQSVRHAVPFGEDVLERGLRIRERHAEPGRSLPLLLSGQRCRGGSQVTPVAGREILLDRGRVPAVA
jgi:hypothetical protein